MSGTSWHASGLLFENCSCQLLCPAHVSFKQICTGDRCRGHWAFHIDVGRFGETAIDDLTLVIVFEAPVRMYSGDWTQIFYIDRRASGAQRVALEAIFSGRAGGPWAVLNRFVAHQLDTQVVPMRFEDRGREKHVAIPDVLETTVTAIRGSDGEHDAVVSNLYNVIHGPEHVLARGHTRSTNPTLAFEHERTHGLYSCFSWEGTG